MVIVQYKTAAKPLKTKIYQHIVKDAGIGYTLKDSTRIGDFVPDFIDVLHVAKRLGKEEFQIHRSNV